MKMSVDKVLEIAKTITTLRIRLPNGSVYTETLFTTPQQEAIKPLLDALDQDKNQAGWRIVKVRKYSIQGMSIVFRTAARYGFFTHADGALDTSEKQ